MSPDPRFVALLEQARRPLVVCGPMDAPADLCGAVVEWAHEAGLPLVADVGSNLRFTGGGKRVIATHATVLRAEATLPSPDLVVHLGGLPTSKGLNTWLQKSGARHVRITDTPRWKDPSHTVTDVLAMPLRVLGDLPAPSLRAEARAYHTMWTQADHHAREALATALAETPDSYEALYGALGDILREPATVFIANSLAIRDADTFWPESTLAHRCYVNRGANGIDGIVSTAAGCAAADGRPLLLLTGDLAFLHDNNGLQLLREAGVRGAALIINNDGGGLFSHIVPPETPATFERCFTTPHGLHFQGLAEMYGLRYLRTGDVTAAGEALRNAMAAPGFSLVELTVSLAESLQRRAALHHRVEQRTEATL